MLTLNRTPAVLLPVPWAGYVVVLQPELSEPELAGSVVLPPKNAWLTPPTREAVPVPIEGVVTPVVVLVSGGVLLKSHWAITEGGSVRTVNVATALVRLPK